ncbi:MAG: Gldg family protein [Parabacteroides sp.]|nr:Gldg family protein [Parabacteroides sp.]
MKKFSYRSSMKNKKSLKYGGYATVTTIVLLTALVLTNVLFNLLGWEVDLTVEKLYTPSEVTEEILDGLEEDITIYGLYNTGTETTNTNKNVITLVNEYCDLCDYLSFETVDPLQNPTFTSKYLADSTLDNGSLIVVNEVTGKFKTIPISNMYEVTTDYEYLLQNITGFTAENELTNAILYVTLEQVPTLYELDGHSEAKLDDNYVEYLGYANYQVESMNIVLDQINEIKATEHTVILVNNPQTDLDENEYNILLNYMETGGRMIFMAANNTPDLPNFSKLLSRYGLSIQTGTMYERNMNYYYQYCNVLKPEISRDSEVSAYLVEDTNNYVIMLAPAAIEISEERSSRILVESLLTTSEDAIIKGEGNPLSSTDYQEGDLTGPFNLCVTAEETLSLNDGTVATSKLAVVGSSDFINVEENQFVTTGNYKLFTLICDSMQDVASTLSISTKSLEEGMISSTAADFLFYGALFTIVIPAAIMITGIVIWVRRKHR